MVKGIGYPPPAQFPGLTTPGIPVANHVLRAILGGVTLGSIAVLGHPGLHRIFFLNYLSVKCRGSTTDPPKDASPSLNDGLRRTQAVCPDGVLKLASRFVWLRTCSSASQTLSTGGFLTNDRKQLCYVEPNLVKPFLLQGMS